MHRDVSPEGRPFPRKSSLIKAEISENFELSFAFLAFIVVLFAFNSFVRFLAKVVDLIARVVCLHLVRIAQQRPCECLLHERRREDDSQRREQLQYAAEVAEQVSPEMFLLMHLWNSEKFDEII